MSAPLFLPPVADTLLLQFKSLAKARIDQATPQARPWGSCHLPE
jgi:hypothetical protein